MSTTELTLVVAGVVAGVTVLTFVQAVIEYRRQGRERRAQHFFDIGKRMEERDCYERICRMLEDEFAGEPNATGELEAVAPWDKATFLAAFEELALTMKSGLVSPEVTHYMYGFYAILCLRSKGFWVGPKGGPPLSDDYWVLFKAFAEEMSNIESRGSPKINKLKF